MTINQLRKKIKTIAITTGEYPKQLEITEKEFEELKMDKFEGVKLIVRR